MIVVKKLKMQSTNMLCNFCGWKGAIKKIQRIPATVQTHCSLHDVPLLGSIMLGDWVNIVELIPH